jgi:sigma-B regulation protein RsbU (phosphoserine phosphatase)
VPAPEETRVLIVDDNKLDRELLRIRLEHDGYATEQTVDGLQAWNVLQANPLKFDVVLLDRSMPQMDGLQLMARMKEHPRLRMLPVILQTALNTREAILEGIRAGAYYYLTKPWDPTELLRVVETAAHDHAERRLLQERVRRGLKVLTLLREARFSIRTVDEARDLGSVLANCCPDPMNSVIGITELLVNAVEHGNLGITYEEKTALNADGTWDDEVKRRLALPENANKRVEMLFERDDREICFTIRDEGSGFDFQRFLDVDPQRAFDNHGRGIAMARRLSFDSLEYRGAGNEVVGRVRLGAPS